MCFAHILVLTLICQGRARILSYFSHTLITQLCQVVSPAHNGDKTMDLDCARPIVRGCSFGLSIPAQSILWRTRIWRMMGWSLRPWVFQAIRVLPAGFIIFIPNIRWSKCWGPIHHVLPSDLCLQEIPLKPLNQFLEKNWNDLNAVPKSMWLTSSREEKFYEQRMHIIGNLVVPRCAALGAEILRTLVSGNVWLAEVACAKWWSLCGSPVPVQLF